MTNVGDDKMDNKLRMVGTRMGSTSRRMVTPRLAGAVATAILLLGSVGVARATIGATPIVAQPVTVKNSGGTGLLFNFMHGADGTIWEDTWTGSGWTGEQNLVLTIQGEPAAASWGTNRVDVFVRDVNNNLEWADWTGSTTSYAPVGWTVVGTGMTGDPVAVSTAVGFYDVLYRNTSGNISVSHSDFGSWTSTSISTPFGVISRIAVVASQGAAFAFWLGSNSALFMSTRANGGTTWTTPQQVSAGPFDNNPSATAFGSAQIPEVFIQTSSGTLAWFQDNNGTLSTEILGAPSTFQGSPAAVAWNTNHINVFFIGNDNSFWNTYFDGSTWHNFSHINGNAVGGSPSVVNWGAQNPPQTLQVYMRGTNGQLWNAWWNGGWNGYSSSGAEVFE
jgi:hypothetical protein